MATERINLGRRRFVSVAAKAVVGGSAAAFAAPVLRQGAPATRRPAVTRPNVLVIMTDQQRYSSLPCYGVNAVAAPNLSKLAREGVVFEHCYVNNPICTPSRASLWTGKNLPQHGVYRLHDILPTDQVLITKRLQEAGYHTALFGKLHVSGMLHESTTRHPNDGFDVYEWCQESSLYPDSPFNGYSHWLREKNPALLERFRNEGRKVTHVPRQFHLTHWAAERTIDFIRRSDASRPFFCLMSVFDPHNPYDGYPLDMEKLVDRSRTPDPAFTPGESAQKPYGIRYEHAHSYLGAFSKFTSQDLGQMRLGYFAALALLDLEIGRVLATLEEKGITQNTLVIFTSDHGDMLGDHELLVKGAFFYDPCVRVPLLMRWPGRWGSGVRVRHLVQSNDIAATILSVAGCFPDDRQQEMPESHNLEPLGRGESAPVREQAICCYRNSGVFDTGGYADPPIHATMLRDARYKLNFYSHPQEPHEREGELYDMENDPGEQTNLWNDARYQNTRARMTEALLSWMSTQELLLGSRGGDVARRPSNNPVNHRH